MNFHVEVHTKWNEIEHFICLNCENETEAQERIFAHYKEKDIPIALWVIAKDHPEIGYYIFRIEELDDKPVVYISGEYRSSYPI